MTKYSDIHRFVPLANPIWIRSWNEGTDPDIPQTLSDPTHAAPDPPTDLMVHILARAYTASKPWLTDWERRLANSWLLKIFRLQPATRKMEKISHVDLEPNPNLELLVSDTDPTSSNS